MILTNNSNPKNSLYYIGGLILLILKKEKEMDYLDLYIKLKKEHGISLPLYNFALDWLYLISAATLDDKEGVVKCI